MYSLWTLLVLPLLLGSALACSDESAAEERERTWILGIQGDKDESTVNEILNLVLGDKDKSDFIWRAKGLLLCQFKRDQSLLDPLLSFVVNHDKRDNLTDHQVELLSKVSWIHENDAMDSCESPSPIQGMPDAHRQVHTTATVSWGLDRLDQIV